MSEISINALSELFVVVPNTDNKAKSNNVKNFPLYLVCEYGYGRYSDYLSNMYDYLEPRMTWPRRLVVNVSDFGTRGPESNRGRAPIVCGFLFLIF